MTLLDRRFESIFDELTEVQKVILISHVLIEIKKNEIARCMEYKKGIADPRGKQFMEIMSVKLNEAIRDLQNFSPALPEELDVPFRELLSIISSIDEPVLSGIERYRLQAEENINVMAENPGDSSEIIFGNDVLRQLDKKKLENCISRKSRNLSIIEELIRYIPDPKVYEVLDRFIENEQVHYEMLIQNYVSIQNSGEWMELP